MPKKKLLIAYGAKRQALDGWDQLSDVSWGSSVADEGFLFWATTSLIA
jgi:hypothetical protein